MSDDAEPKSTSTLSGLSLTFLAPAEGEGASQARPLRPVPAEASRSEEARVVIVGSGPAGLTAAIYAARANLEPIVIGGISGGGQLMITSEVENYPGFPEGIEGPELMGLFRKQAERFGARIVDADVERVDSRQPAVPALGRRRRIPRPGRHRRHRRRGALAGDRE